MWINNFESRNDLFIDWILEDAPPTFTVLDVGANNGKFTPQVTRIFERATHVCGVDPDSKKLMVNPYLQERYPTTLEGAPLSNEAFDIAYSIYVAEHVENPEIFLRAAYNALKPGGSFFIMTPNLNHYFALISGTLGKLGLQEFVLKKIMPVEHVEDYHYPAYYKMNRASQVRKQAEVIGFSNVEFRYSEDIRDLEVYFPSFTKIAPRLWLSAMKVFGTEKLLCNLMIKLTK